MVTASEKREEGNELFRAGQHAAAAAAYGEAIGLVAHEVGALAMAAGGPDDDGDPAAAQEPGLGTVPSKLKETCVACHANRAACYLALAEEDDGQEDGVLSVSLAGEEAQLAFVVPEFGAQSAELVGIRAVPLSMVGSVATGAEPFAVVLDGASTPIAGWGKRARDTAKAFAAARAILIVSSDDVLHYPPDSADGGAATSGAAAGPAVPVVCLRRDEGADLLSGSVDSLTLRFVEPAALYRRVIDDCAAARNLAGGTHAKAQLRGAQALEALGRLDAAHTEYSAAAKEEDSGVRKKARSGAKRVRGLIKAAKEGASLLPDQTVWAVSSAPLTLRKPDTATAEQAGDGATESATARFVAVVGLDNKGLRQIAAQVVNEGGARALTVAARDVLASAATTEMVAGGAGRRPRMVIADAANLGRCAIGLLRGCAAGVGLPLLVDDEACCDLAPLAASVAAEMNTMGWGEQLKLSEKDAQTAGLQQALGELRAQKTAEAAAAADEPSGGVTTEGMLAALKEAAEGGGGGAGAEDALAGMMAGIQPS
eukprot:COSAG06_NODE_840_length_11999_cov_16.819412_8_plen_541_part_00